MLASLKKSLSATFVVLFYFGLSLSSYAQSGGNSTSVVGTITDSTGAVVGNATVYLRNPVSGFERSTTTDSSGKFSIPNVPFNPNHLTVSGVEFAMYAQDVDVRSVVPVNVSISLQVKGSSESVTVEAAGDLLENDPAFHTDLERGLFDKLPLESQSSSVSSLVTLATPGIAADSNGLFHGGRPRRELIFGRRPANHRSAEQSLLKPNSPRFDPVDGSHLWRATGRIRRES